MLYYVPHLYAHTYGQFLPTPLFRLFCVFCIFLTRSSLFIIFYVFVFFKHFLSVVVITVAVDNLESSSPKRPVVCRVQR